MYELAGESIDSKYKLWPPRKYLFTKRILLKPENPVRSTEIVGGNANRKGKGGGKGGKFGKGGKDKDQKGTADTAAPPPRT